ncbi:MAG: hypothetical protein J6U54_08730 [Clostridiales bacterium]|nr:hypothetical protein [Clostridiales bacterium]
MFGKIIANAMLSSNAVVNTVGSTLYKNADKILLGFGIGSVCAGTVSAIMTTTKIKDVIEDHERCMAQALEGPEEGRGKRKFEVYKDTAIDLIKAYGPCVLLTSIGIASIMGSHYILSSRYATLSVAYAAMDQSFKEYRNRVKDVVGAEKEYDIYNNAYEVEEWDSEKDGVDKKGNPITRKEKYYNGSKSPYSFLFCEQGLGNYANPNFQKDDPQANIMFLEQRQEWLNRKLDHKKIVTLAEVLYDLGFVEDGDDIPTYAFQMVWDKNNPNGDQYIDLGHRYCMPFMAGNQDEVWLNFNCDGLLSKIRKEKDPILKTEKGSVNKTA